MYQIAYLGRWETLPETAAAICDYDTSKLECETPCRVMARFKFCLIIEAICSARLRRSFSCVIVVSSTIWISES